MPADDELVVVARFHLAFEAQIAQARLEASGIPAFLENVGAVNADWLLSNAIGGVVLLTPISMAVEAATILASPGLDAEFDEAAERGETTRIPKTACWRARLGNANRWRETHSGSARVARAVTLFRWQRRWRTSACHRESRSCYRRAPAW